LRVGAYVITAIVLAAYSLYLSESPWSTTDAFHTALESVSTVLAFIIGALALVRFYNRKQGTFLFLGTGFLGTGVLDGYHALVAGSFPEFTDPDLVAWTWIASRVFLSLFLLAAYVSWRRESRRGVPAVREDSVYLVAFVLTALVFGFFMQVPVTGAYFQSLYFSRPAEFIPALLYGAALAGFIRKGEWRRDSLEHWVNVSLVIAVLTHAIFMSRSSGMHDALFDAAHALKVASYVAILVGLLISVYVTFRREVRALEAVRQVNESMAYEVGVRRQAEQVYQETEERLQNFLDTAHDLIQSSDPEGRLVYANRAWQRTLGYELEELEGLRLWDLLDSESAARVRKQHQELLSGESVGRLVLELRARDGRLVVCSGNATVHRVEGKPVAVQAILRDVTEQRRAEKELAASRANLAALVENTGDAIWSVGPDLRLITFNSAFALSVEARTGREPEHGDRPEDIFDPVLARFYTDLYDRTLRGERFNEQVEDEVQGQMRAIEIFCNPISGDEGVAGAVMFGRDVTRRRRAEEALKMAKEEAEAANRAKSQFLASMSHELRTPLNSVIGFANILLKNKAGNLDEKQVGFLGRIMTNGRHLLSLINDVLDLAKIEAGRMELEIEEANLATLVTETVHQLEGRVTEKDVKLIADVPAELPSVQTDVAKLRQVIINLVGNALKFTEHGSVTVRIETLRGPGSAATAIHVVDTGIGIPDDRLEAIFEAFQQADGSTSRKYGGTGLGLAISRSICQLLGYDLTVSSAVGEGSTFSILLLDAAEREEALHAEEHVDDKSREVHLGPDVRELMAAHPMRDFLVLVVDDEVDSRVVLSHYLEDFGCKVLTAATAPEGLELARMHHPDLITLDLVMPGVDGWQALQTLKDDPELRSIPVVVVSIVAGEEGHGRLIGAVDLLNKPIERKDLLRVLWRNLAPQRGGRVLVVDDDADTRVVLEEYLREAGFEVTTARHGKEALEKINGETPDAVLLDLLMPVMDGMTFLEHLRAEPRHLGLPVIVLTGKDLSDLERETLGAVTSGIISKGSSVDERLREVLGSLIPLINR
jgi:PAS domain S-box-containing protein